VSALSMRPILTRYDPLKHHRHSIRLKGYDYSRAGAYFVTTVNQGRTCIYGKIVSGEMVLNAAGQMIEKWWLELNQKFPAIETDAYVVMPNHFHGIVVIVEAGDIGPAGGEGAHIGAPQPGAAQLDDGETNVGADLRVRPGARVRPGTRVRPGAAAPLHRVIQWFKTMTTNEYIRGVKTLGWPPFERKLWQRDYYERILRDAGELERTRRYISDNPLQWEQDDENPAVIAASKPH
jgi:putative transposase